MDVLRVGLPSGNSQDKPGILGTEEEEEDHLSAADEVKIQV